MDNRPINAIPYLMFEGNCEQALNFYQNVLGGELIVVNRYDNPAMKAPELYQDKILHARLELNGMTALYAGDTFPGTSTKKNNGDVSLFLVMNDNFDKTKEIFTRLAEGGKIGFPFKKQFRGAWHGSLTDRYGFNWHVNFEETVNDDKVVV